MNAADVVGYTHDGAAYCGVSCLPEGIDPGGEEVGAIFAGSEWDAYPTCDTCRGIIDEVSLVHYPCKNCGHAGPNAQDTGNLEECIACHKAPPALREMLGVNFRTDGKPATLDACTLPGGYPILYVTRSSEVLCADCATKALRNDDHDAPVAYEFYYEGPSEFCTSCGEEIESAYGDPDAPDRERDHGKLQKLRWLRLARSKRWHGIRVRNMRRKRQDANHRD
jgi:predicted RNA-binding Zn-ribbon protein involved in translation (DUF1610 family)